MTGPAGYPGHWLLDLEFSFDLLEWHHSRFQTMSGPATDTMRMVALWRMLTRGDFAVDDYKLENEMRLVSEGFKRSVK
jgi:hypothetical protein